MVKHYANVLLEYGAFVSLVEYSEAQFKFLLVGPEEEVQEKLLEFVVAYPFISVFIDQIYYSLSKKRR